MTKVTYYAGCNEIKLEGHAGSGPSGQDLVCCALSTLAFSLKQALEDREIPYACREDDGSMHIIAAPEGPMQNMETDIIFRTMASGFWGLASNYPDYVIYIERGGN